MNGRADDPVTRPNPTYVNHYQGERNQAWRTPNTLFASLHAEFQFTLDGAASPDTALTARYSSLSSQLPWTGERVFCNPPWSDIAPFVERAATASLAVLLVPARTNAKWFHRALALGAQPRFFVGKPRFSGARWNSPVDCLLLVFGNALPEYRLPVSDGNYIAHKDV